MQQASANDAAARVPSLPFVQSGLVVLLALVFALAYLDLRRDQGIALADFSLEQAALARSFAATLEARLGGVLRELESAAAVADDPLGPAFLDELLRNGRGFLAGALIEPDGSASHELDVGAGAGLDPARRLEFRQRALQRIGSGPGTYISEPLGESGASSHDAPLRYVLERRGTRAVEAVLNLDPLFDVLMVGDGPAGPAPLRLLVVDHLHQWVEFGEPPTGALPVSVERWRAGESGLPRAVAGLLEAMESGSDGARFLDDDAATSLGLAGAAVAGFAPVRLDAHHGWAVAAVTSAHRLNERDRVAVVRLAATTGVASLLVALFALVVVRQERRARSLAEKLRFAATVAELREHSERIVESLPVGILEVDADLRVRTVNPYLAQRGVRAGALLADALPRASAPEILALEHLLRDARQAHATRERLSLRMHLGGEEPRDVDAYAVPLATPLSGVDCFLVLHDRTELRALERSLVRAEKLATVGTLAAGVAHEIGTPLGIISGRAEQLLARQTPEADEAQRRALASIISQVEKVSTIIRQLLDFSHPRPVEARAIEPALVIESVATLIEPLLARAEVRLELAIDPGLPFIAGDPGQLEQVFMNLVLNARDACRPGGTVRVRALEQAERVVFEVADDGCGIPAENLQRVLDPFFTTKKRGHGTGLGLPIAADIVRNHGGALEIDSEVGRGTTVRVMIPVAAAQPSAP
jgi:signal transduction histidine kinase